MSQRKRFRYYFTADLVSMFGSGMSFIGLNWYILNLTGSNRVVGDLFSIGILSGFLAFPFSGFLADYFNRKKVMLAMNGFRALTLTGMALLFFSGYISVWWLFLMRFINGAANNIFFSSSRGLAQELLKDEDMLKGNSLLEFSMQAGNFVSAALAGILYKYTSVGVILLIDAGTYIISSILISRITYSKLEQSDMSEPFTRKMSDGFSYLKSNGLIFGLGIAMLIPQIVTMCSNIVFPNYILNHLKADSVVFGLNDMFYAVGAAGAGFLTVYVSRKLSTLKLVILFHSLTILMLIFLTGNTMVAGVFTASALWGYGNSSIRILINTRIMQLVPKNYMGRATAVWRALSMGLSFTSSFLLGRLLDRIPPVFGFIPFIPLMFSGLVLCSWFLFQIDRESKSTVTNRG